jgi:hypothetical protein
MAHTVAINDGPVLTKLHLENDGSLGIQREQDAAPTLAYAKAMRDEGLNESGLGKKVGSYPAAAVEMWLKMRGLTWADFHSDALKQFVNDPELSGFRIWTGRS